MVMKRLKSCYSIELYAHTTAFAPPAYRHPSMRQTSLSADLEIRCLEQAQFVVLAPAHSSQNQRASHHLGILTHFYCGLEGCELFGAAGSAVDRDIGELVDWDARSDVWW